MAKFDDKKLRVGSNSRNYSSPNVRVINKEKIVANNPKSRITVNADNQGAKKILGAKNSGFKTNVKDQIIIGTKDTVATFDEEKTSSLGSQIKDEALSSGKEAIKTTIKTKREIKKQNSNKINTRNENAHLNTKQQHTKIQVKSSEKSTVNNGVLKKQTEGVGKLPQNKTPLQNNNLNSKTKIQPKNQVVYKVDGKTGELKRLDKNNIEKVSKNQQNPKLGDKLNSRQKATLNKNTKLSPHSKAHTSNINARRKITVNKGPASTAKVVNGTGLKPFPTGKMGIGSGGASFTMPKPNLLKTFGTKFIGGAGVRIGTKVGGFLIIALAGIITIVGGGNYFTENIGLSKDIPSAGQYYYNGYEPSESEWKDIRKYVEAGYSYTVDYEGGAKQSTGAIKPENTESLISSMTNETKESVLREGVNSLGVSEDWMKLLIGTTEREGYASEDPYLEYAWACEMINSYKDWDVASIYRLMEGWGAGYYSQYNVENFGYETVDERTLKCVSLAISNRDTAICEVDGMINLNSPPAHYELLYASDIYNCQVWGNKNWAHSEYSDAKTVSTITSAKSKIKDGKILVSQKTVDELLFMEQDLIKDKTGNLVAGVNTGDPLDAEYMNITSGYGPRGLDGFHNGIDFGAPEGSNVYTIADGVVEHAASCNYNTYGINNAHPGGYIVINHENFYSEYMHLSKVNVSIGDEVKKGQLIGLSGNTGASLGAHLHLGVSNNGFPTASAGNRIDPTPYLHKKTNGTTVTSTISDADKKKSVMTEIIVNGKPVSSLNDEKFDYKKYKIPYTYIGKTTAENTQTTTISIPTFVKATEIKQKDKKSSIAIQYILDTYQQGRFYYPDSNKKQYLGEPAVINNDKNKKETISKNGEKLVGWSFKANSKQADFGVYQEFTSDVYARLLSSVKNKVVRLYPVWTDSYSDSKEIDIYPVTKEDGTWYLGTKKASKELIPYLSEKDFVFRYAYVDDEGVVNYVEDEDDILTSYNRTEIYKAILAMATIATSNSADDYPQTFVEYAKDLLQKALGENSTCTVEYNAKIIPNTAGVKNVGERWSKNGATYQADKAILTTTVTIYLSAAPTALVANDSTTGETFKTGEYKKYVTNDLVNAAYRRKSMIVSGMAKKAVAKAGKLIVSLIDWIGDDVLGIGKTGWMEDLDEFDESASENISKAVEEMLMDDSQKIFDFQGWSSEKDREELEKYKTFKDDEFRDMFNVVFPPLTAYMPGDDNSAIAFSMLVNNGYSPEAACSVLGVIQHLSKFDETLVNGNKYGLLQTSLKKLEGYSKGLNQKWPNVDLNTQIKFIMNILETSDFGDETFLSYKKAEDIDTITGAFYDRLTSGNGLADSIEKAKEFYEKVVFMPSDGNMAEFLHELQKIADDDSHGYCNYVNCSVAGHGTHGNWGDPDYDCGSYVSAALRNIGIFKSGDIYEPAIASDVLPKAGFRKMAYAGKNSLVAGDILVGNGHTIVYIGDNKMAGAEHDSDGVHGDTTGTEIVYGSHFYENNWSEVYRYSGTVVENTSSEADKVGSYYGKAPIGFFNKSGMYGNTYFVIGCTSFTANKYETQMAATANPDLPIGTVIKVKTKASGTGSYANNKYFIITSHTIPTKLIEQNGKDYIYLSAGGNSLDNNNAFSDYSGAEIYVMNGKVSSYSAFKLKY